MKVQQLLDLMGSVVSFEYHPSKGLEFDVYTVKGLVTCVSVELTGRHALSVQDYESSEDFYQIERIKNLKAVQLDPYAFFDNVKNGTIKIDL